MKLARLTNNYAVLMMFSTPSRSHQQSAISGCCAVFVWKSHPICMTSASSDQEEAFQGDMLAPIPTKQRFFWKCAAAYRQLMMSNLVRVLIWLDSCFRAEHHGLGSTLQPARAVVTSDHQWMGWERSRGVCTSTNGEKQQKENSLAEGKERQTGCPGSSHLCHHGDQAFDKLWEPVALDREREGGRWYFKWKRCRPWNFLALSVTSLPPCLHASVQWWDLSNPCLDGHGAQPSSHREDRALGLVLVRSRSEDGSQGSGGWVAEYWEMQRVQGVRRSLGRIWGSLNLGWKTKQNCFFKIIWGLTSGPHWGTCCVWGIPCIMATNPEWQLTRLLSSSLFVARRCHDLLLILQTDRRTAVPSAPPTSVLIPSPSAAQCTSTKFAFSLWSKTIISRASYGLGH